MRLRHFFNMTIDELKHIIEKSHSEKIGKRHPEHVTVREITDRYPEAKQLIDSLQTSGDLILGRTINDKYIARWKK